MTRRVKELLRTGTNAAFTHNLPEIGDQKTSGELS